jgi:hypothetical protein
MRKKGIKPVHLDQWLEIEEIDGICTVKRYPPNHEFEELRQKMNPPAELIYRRMFFLNGIPSDYWQLCDKPGDENLSGLFLQRILPDEWASILDRETASGTDVIILASRPQPRPEALGPCPCPKCREEREKGIKSRYE